MHADSVPVVHVGTVDGRKGPPVLPEPPVVVVVGEGGGAPVPSGPRPGVVVVALSSGVSGARVTVPAEAPPDVREAVLEMARQLALAEWREARDRAIRERRADLEQELLEIGTALAEERDLGALLERILRSARRLVSADAGSIYLVEKGRDGAATLRFVRAQNESREPPDGGAVIPLDRTSMAGMAAVTGEPVVVADAYTLPPDAPFTFNGSFDERSGYRSRSVLAVPMITRSRETVGVIQLINRKRRPGVWLHTPEAVAREVVPFDDGDLELLRSLAAQAAVVLENSRLLERIETLFESFVTASITAIEQRDPPTSGHSLRVARLATALARAVDRERTGRFAEVAFSPADLRQLRYAALLHDIGKVGVREAVLTKRTRLGPDREATIVERLGHAAVAETLRAAEEVVAGLVAGGRPPGEETIEAIADARERVRERTLGWIRAVERANREVPLPAGLTGPLGTLAGTVFEAFDGSRRPLLEPEELRHLTVPSGNLDETERREIESHVVHSHRFLTTLPWPPDLARIPEIVARHHEKLDGSGYPEGVTAESIPLEARILAIADVYDALTAGDRPYKPALPVERALEILRDEARGGMLDADLVALFASSGAYRAAEDGDRA